MNRPIRFRIWDTRITRFIEGNEVFVGPSYADLDDSLFYVYSQFTGLVDSRGRDIYEGDIVRYDIGDLDENERYAKLLTSEVVWERDRWRIRYGADYYIWNKMTVLGNRFETPELLTTSMNRAIRLTKLTRLPDRPNGDLYSVDGHSSITEGYTILGTIDRMPKVGERFLVARTERNGIQMLGDFSTSPVVAIELEDDLVVVFKTQNSIYRMDIL